MPIKDAWKFKWFSNGDYRIPFDEYDIEDDEATLIINGRITAILIGEARKAFLEEIK